MTRLLIKSPQLYRLSYQPELLESLWKASCHLRENSVCVPAVYPGPIATPPYHAPVERITIADGWISWLLRGSR